MAAKSAGEEKRHEEDPQEEASSFDPQKILSRSTSDALLETNKVRLLKKPMMAALSETDMSHNLPEALEDLDTPPISERNKVYFDLTDVAESEGEDLGTNLDEALGQATPPAAAEEEVDEEGVFMARQHGGGEGEPQPEPVLQLSHIYERKGGP